MRARAAVGAAAVAAAIVAADGRPRLSAQQPQTPTQPQCSISASGVDFGVYDTISSTPNDAIGSVTYSCPKGAVRAGATDVIVTIDQGTSGSFNRSMTNGATRLSYNLYLDVGRTTIWGDGSGGTAVHDDKVPPNDRLTTDTVYGRIFPRQPVDSGRYLDSLVVTILF